MKSSSGGKKIWNELLRNVSSGSVHQNDVLQQAKTPGVILTRTRRRTLSGTIASASKKSAIRRSMNEGRRKESTKRIIEGHLSKRGKGMNTLRWRKRFFRLVGGSQYRLQYFRKSDVQCRRMIRQFVIQPGCYVQRLNHSSFRLMFPDKSQGRSKLDLSGTTEKHCMVWITTLSRVIDEVNMSKRMEQLKHSYNMLREENYRLATERYSKRASRYWKIGGAQIKNSGRGHGCEDRFRISNPLFRVKRPPSFDENDSDISTTPILGSVATNRVPLAFICLADGHAGFETAAFVSEKLHSYVRDEIEAECLAKPSSPSLSPSQVKKNSSSSLCTTLNSVDKLDFDDFSIVFTERDREICEVAMERSFKLCEQELRDKETDNGSGACVAAILLSPTSLHVAHLGDCRVVLLWSCHRNDDNGMNLVAKQLTCDHKASVRGSLSFSLSLFSRSQRKNHARVFPPISVRYPQNENVYFVVEES
jgi:serine/threonine protein phosphatase PrpC